MIVPRFRTGLLTAASLLIVATPGLACEPSGAFPSAGSPCACLTVGQDRDLSFSIRRATPGPAPTLGAGPARPAIAIGATLKADLAIFSRQPSKGKDVSDATVR